MKDLDWRILNILGEKKSITQAADVLFMTQSALTKRIKTIENEWNVEVVHRTSKGISLTEDGVYLTKKAVIMLDFLEEIADHFAQKSGEKELVKIGVPNSFARLHLPKLLKGFISEYDELQFKTVPNSSDIILKQLIDEVIDIGIVCGDYQFMGEKIKLFDENWYIVTPKGINLDQMEEFSLIESYFNPLVKSTVDQWWKHHFGGKPHEIHRVPYSDIAIEMVENGLGVSFVFGSEWKCDREKVEVIPVYDKSGNQIGRSVWMMLTNKCFKSQKIMDFISYVESYYQVNE